MLMSFVMFGAFSIIFYGFSKGRRPPVSLCRPSGTTTAIPSVDGEPHVRGKSCTGCPTRPELDHLSSYYKY